MKIKNANHAKDHAARSIKNSRVSVETCIVTESGDVLVNSDFEATCSDLDKSKTTYFIVKGERKKKETPKASAE